MKLNELYDLKQAVMSYLQNNHNSIESMQRGLNKALSAVLGARGATHLYDKVKLEVMDELRMNPKHRNIAGEVPGKSSPVSSQSEVRSPLPDSDDWSEEDIIKAHENLKSNDKRIDRSE